MANKTCDGNCLGCSFQQQTYCSAQRTYQMMKNEEVLFSRLSVMEEALEALEKAFSKFGEGSVFNPLVVEEPKAVEQTAEAEDEAQNGGGAENRPSVE